MTGFNQIQAKSITKLILAGLVSMAVVLTYSSTMAKEAVSKSKLIFSHQLHVKDVEVECSTCHEINEDDPSASMMPKMDICAGCHDAVEDTEDPEGCLMCHNVSSEEMALIADEKEKVDMSQLSHLSLIDRHEVHQISDVKCLTCHKGIDEDESSPFVKGKYLPKPDLCEECHRTQEVEVNMQQDCQTCHKPGTYAKNLKPESHFGSWSRFHGNHSWFAPQEVHGKDCSTCHQEEACTDCHTSKEPKDHTRYFKTRGHGIISTSFTDRCLTCHRQDACLSCHQETAPRNHRGQWLQQGHCVTCHIGTNSSVESNCKVCHATPMHLRQ